MSRRRGREVQAAIAAAIALALAATPLATAASARERFAPETPLRVPEEHLLDVGVADYDGDGWLDIFTTNHKFPSALLRNRAGGGFSDRLAAAGLSPTPQFPGLEHLGRPRMGEPGVYLFLRSPPGKQAPSFVHLRTVGMPATGTLTFASHNVRIARRARAEVGVDETSAGHPVVSLDADPGARVDLRVRHIDLPIAASFEGVEPRDIRVGSRGERASTRDFVLTLRDRHGYAFADLGGDRDLDAFSVSGGLGSAIRLPGYRDQVQDQLLIGRDGRFTDESAASGLTKGACRGRQAASADFNGDGLLDLFEGCEGEPPQLYRQVAPGEFEPAPAPRSTASTSRWVDLSGDPRPELLAAEPGGIRVYRIGTRRARVIQRLPAGPGDGRVAQFAVADVSADADLDVLAVSRSGNAMLANRDGRLHPQPLRVLGLPKSSAAASFVDYDNDGSLDLHLVPQGLLHRVGSGFRPTGELRTPRVGAAITSWPDYDNDGLRDPLVATGPSPFSGSKRVRLERNLGPGGNRWIEIDLDGPPGNAQAIGARVAVRCGARRQFGFVGQSDDARFSQGHYRLYFGLDDCPGGVVATVRWPDGTEDRYGPMRPDRLVRLAYPP